jgi:hypothetical protein
MTRFMGVALAIVTTSGFAWGQPWSGIISPQRAIDWSHAGLPPTLPGGETTTNPWTPPARTKVCATIAPEGTSSAPVAPTDLNAAIQSCGMGQVVQLQAGSYYFNDSVNLFCTTTSPCAHHSVTLRGAGADKTKIHFSGNASFALGGNQDASYFPLASAPAVGSSTVQLTTPNSNITPGTIIGVTQCTTGSSGTTVDPTYGPSCSPTSGVAVYDNGGEFVCNGDGPYCSHGFINPTSAAGSAEAQQGQVQAVAVTAISGTTLTVSPRSSSMICRLQTTSRRGWFIRRTRRSGSKTCRSTSRAAPPRPISISTAATAAGSRAFAWSPAPTTTKRSSSIGWCSTFVSNSYFFSFNSGNYGILNGGSYGLSNGLILNNITEHVCGIEWSGSGLVVAYDYIPCPR